ncbi:hypothetical protein [Methylophilus sp. DW102]|uniref:hypothetical protein n=1 Tax=Methylophilus sp. DW102 TaxID=3095607 RepID=UPI0030907C2E|nr:hypothetical protein MTDW_21550 [Methylophilus sp. DW102]
MLKYYMILTGAVTLTVASISAFAAGSFCMLPASPSGSAYINLYNDGRVIPPLAGPPVSSLLSRTNFGIDLPNGGSAGVCQISGLANNSTAPLPGYGLQVTANTQNIYAVDGTTIIGGVTERIWRKTSTSPAMCILGTSVALTSNAYYNGSRYFELNDIARGGFANVGAVNVGYFTVPTTPALYPVYRAGRTFTSVQHRAYKYDGFQAEKQNNGIGYLDLPTIGGSSTLNINGVNVGILGNTVASASATQQQAQVNTNWVDFTLHAVFLDGDITDPISAMTYIEFPCNNDSAAVINTAWRKSGALRLRQTGQKNSTFHEIIMTGYAPPGAILP